MYLYVINMLQLDSVFQRQSQRITGQMTVIGRVFKQTSDTAGCKNRVIGINACIISLKIMTDNSTAAVILANQIHHGEIFDQRNIFTIFCCFQQMRSDFFSGFIFVE